MSRKPGQHLTLADHAGRWALSSVLTERAGLHEDGDSISLRLRPLVANQRTELRDTMAKQRMGNREGSSLLHMTTTEAWVARCGRDSKEAEHE